MLLKAGGKPTGVRCDLTGEEVFNSFKYYSFEAKKVHVHTKERRINAEGASVDFDVTEKGFELIRSKLMSNQAPAVDGAVKCDLSGKMMRGEFTYWRATAASAEVDIRETEKEASAMSNVETDLFELDISEPEMEEILRLKKENRDKPYDEPEESKKKKTVLRIPAPKSSPKELKPEPKPIPESKPILEPVAEPKPVEPPSVAPITPKQYVRVPGLQRQTFKPRPIKEPEIEIEPQEVKKIDLPKTGTRRNIKKRKP